jgi:hypothetical protein
LIIVDLCVALVVRPAAYRDMYASAFLLATP